MSPSLDPVPNRFRWTFKRRLFIVEQLVLLACLIGGLIFMFAGHGFSRVLEGAIFIAVVVVANIVLRLTYFRTVLPEIREERRRSRQ
jgi:lysylphosphatidylglycerol synthetase-like protein (DUF2156 family)